MMSTRYIENELRDFGANPKKARKGKTRKGNGAVEDAILHSALRLSLQRILRETPPSEMIKSRDFSVYTGAAGYCLLFLLLHSRGIGFGVSGRTGQLAGYTSPIELAMAYLDAAQASLERQEARKGAGNQGFTFLTGAAGVHAVGAAVAQRAGDTARSRYHAREVADMEERAMSRRDHRSHELMYGLAGYLNALLFIRANTKEEIGEEEIPDPLILRIVDRIVSDGADFPSEGRWGSPSSSTSLSQQEASKDDDDGDDDSGYGFDVPGEEKRMTGVSDGGTPTSGSGDGDDVAVGQSDSRNASKADQWGEADPDAEGWDNSSNRRRVSGGSGGANLRRGARNSGGRGRRGGRRRKGSSSSSGQDGAAAKAAAAEVAAEAEEATSSVGTGGGEGYGGVLTYEWHSKMYLGAAHGVSGILFVLMQALQTVYGSSLLVEIGGDGAGRQDLPPQAAEQLFLIRSTVDAIIETALPEGNFPSRPSSRDDRLVQWCHGAPGVIPTLTKAYEVFEDERYLEAARRSSDVVWKRGVLTKGNGLCHGVAGNGYAFLSLRKTDGGDGRHLHRARSFAGFTASAVLGPDPSAGENAFRGDPFGPGAHAHTRTSGSVGGLSRSSSHDSGNSLPSLGWPSSAHGKLASAAACGATAAATGAMASNCSSSITGGSSAGGRVGIGARSSSVGSASALGCPWRVGEVAGLVPWHELPVQAVPDRPMSLFEGLAGAAAFLADMVPEAGAGKHACFPSFELFP